MAILFCQHELAQFYSALGWTKAAPGTIASTSDAPLCMVRHASTSEPDLVAKLQRTPLTLRTAW